MKSALLCLSVSVILIISCSKSNTAVQAPTSQWTISGVTYRADSTVLFSTPNSGVNMEGVDTGIDQLYINFDSLPTMSRTYLVNSGDGGNPNNKYCSISVENSTAIYFGIAEISGEQVNVTVNGGKIIASFNNIAVQDIYNIYDTAYISGTLIQQ